MHIRFDGEESEVVKEPNLWLGRFCKDLLKLNRGYIHNVYLTCESLLVWRRL